MRKNKNKGGKKPVKKENEVKMDISKASEPEMDENADMPETMMETDVDGDGEINLDSQITAESEEDEYYLDSENTVQEEPDNDGKRFVIKKEDVPRFITADIALAFAIILVILYAVCFSGSNSDDGLDGNTVETEETQMIETEPETETAVKTVSVIGVDDSDETEDSENKMETAAETGMENWQETVFGSSEGSVIRSVEVSGLTRSQKEKAGYRESDFITTLSAFLSENGLDEVTEVTFIDEVSCSSDSAYAFIATMDAESDELLTAIMYPDYPGYYILMLQDAAEIADTIGTEADTEEDTGETETVTEAAAEQEIQVETEAGQTGQQQTAASTETQVSISGTQGDYNANNLSVTNIPAVLANYLSNKYELQYTLYDYLYESGRTDITSASVSSYEIDPDTRVATISFRLSNGSSITGTYDWNSNTYSYH
ncbi:MAG: hypothetical protein LUI39_12550 [Lachnospiraceae bacterium]|nr:hypothetical protein [Lachnospiraceae bacterium]